MIDEVVEKIKRGLKKRKVKIFFVFTVLSGLAWLISNLSETYNSTTIFQLKYVNEPDSLFLQDTSKDRIRVRLRAGGFQFIRFNFKNKTIRIDLGMLEGDYPSYYISPRVYRDQVEQQLSTSMALLEMDQDTIFLDFLKLSSKEVPARPRIHLDLAQNYLLDGNLDIEPSTIKLTGPKSEIDTIHEVRTKTLDLSGRTEDFSESVPLEIPEYLSYTTFSHKTVQVNGKLARFSEKVFEVPIIVKNLPQGSEIRTFPNKVSLLCKAKLNELKAMGELDFQVVADYGASKDQSTNTLKLEIVETPKNVHSVHLMQDQVEFILKRE